MVVVQVADLAGTLLGGYRREGRREDDQSESDHVRCSRRRRGRGSGWNGMRAGGNYNVLTKWINLESLTETGGGGRCM